MWNSLSQTLLKIASPGVPDFYQGSEIWDFRLVDPDNRLPVDYDRRRELLQKLRGMQEHGAMPLIEEAAANPSDGLIKLYITSRALCFRKSHRDLLTEGSYVPLRAIGHRQNHVVSFARTLGERSMIAVAGRFFMDLGAPKSAPIGESAWGDSALLLRRDLAGAKWRDVFSQTTIPTVLRNGKPVLPLAEVFAHLPLALLEAVE